MPKSLHSLKALRQAALITTEQQHALSAVEQTFQIGMTATMQQVVGMPEYTDPIFRQFVPDLAELNILPQELYDPIGDVKHSPVEGIVHRYPDRVLLKLTQACAVYCRFCFRREMIGAKGIALSESELVRAMNYIHEHPQIWEVILTGGDPLIVSLRRLKTVIDELIAIPHVENIRIHTRIPIVDPARITSAMLAQLRRIVDADKGIYVVIHANHAQEFTASAKIALNSIADAGIPMLSQSVLLRDINDNVDSLRALMRILIKHRIKPYYLHQMDWARGTSHFRVSDEKARELMIALRASISGICVPTLIEEIPDGIGKKVIY